MLVLAGHTEPDTHPDDLPNLIMQAAEGLLGIQLLRSASQPLASAAIDRVKIAPSHPVGGAARNACPPLCTGFRRVVVLNNRVLDFRALHLPYALTSASRGGEWVADGVGANACSG